MKNLGLFIAMLFAVLVAGCATFGAPVPGCGNGVIEANEACDDGNTQSGDGCDRTCHSEDVEWSETYDTWGLKVDFAEADKRDRHFAVLFYNGDPLESWAENGYRVNSAQKISEWWAKQPNSRLSITTYDALNLVYGEDLAEYLTWSSIITERAGGLPAMVVHRWKKKEDGKYELLIVKVCGGIQECTQELQEFLVKNPPEKVRECHLKRR